MRKTKQELAEQLIKLNICNRRQSRFLCDRFKKSELEKMVKEEIFRLKTQNIIFIKTVLLSDGNIYEYVAFTSTGKRYYQAEHVPKHILRFIAENPSKVS